MPQIRNTGLVANLVPDFQLRHEPNFAWACAGAYSQLTGLRGWWGTGAVNETPAALDQSDNGRSLSLSGAVTFGAGDLAPYAAFTGATYLYRADEAGLDTLGTDAWHPAMAGMTVGCWVRFTNNASGAIETVMAKSAALGHRTWTLRREPAGQFSFYVSWDGTNLVGATYTTVLVKDTWYFVCGRFKTSTSISVFVNRTEAKVASAIAGLFNSDARLSIGANGVPANYLTGYVSNAFLCAAALNDAQIVTTYEMTRAMYGV